MGDSAASGLKDWNTAKANCVKLLGKKGKLTKPKADDPSVTLTKAVASAKALDEDIQKLLKAIRAYQSMLLIFQSDTDKYKKEIEKDDFGLSRADTEEERIINKVHYELAKCLTALATGAMTPVDFGFKLRKVMEGTENMTDF